MSCGTLHGVGLGPGDPDLMSLRANRLITTTTHIAYFRKTGRQGQARRIVEGFLATDTCEIAMEYPVTTEIPLSDPSYNQILAEFYNACSDRLLDLLRSGKDVVVLCEGDPFFYGSFMHLHSRLKNSVPVQVVPAITGMSGAWTATGLPMTWGDDILTVLMGTLPKAKLVERMAGSDALVVMKIGSNFEKVRYALAQSGRLNSAWLVENATMPDEKVHPLIEVDDHIAPYFSIVIVHGQGRRP